MKKIIACLLAITMLLGLGACGSKPETAKTDDTATTVETDTETPTEGAAAGPFEILCLVNNFADQNSLNYANAVEARAKELGDLVKVSLLDSQSDVSTQLAQVEDAITKGIDAIIMQPNDSAAMSTAVDLCAEAGVPLIEMSLKTENGAYTAFVGLSDVVGGQIEAAYIFEQLGGKGKVAYVLGNEGSSAVNDRKAGFDAALEEYPEITLVAEQSARWQRAEALELAEDWLTRYPDLNAILCQNDDMAMGVIEAVESMGREDVLVAGINAIAEGLTAVKDGSLACTVYMDSHNVGVTSLNLAVSALQGEPVEKETRLDMKIVHKDNIDDYLK